MNRRNRLVILSGLIVAIGITVVASLNGTSKVVSENITELHVVDTKTLMKKINSKEDMVIVDLREPELFSQSRVPGSINIPFEEIPSRYTELPNDKNVVFVCHTGRMGMESGNLLLENGYKQVYNLDGGIAKWTGKLEK
ncbi:rhodanese-like domain-containing protein [Sporosarcina sp. 179-K 3D1 HS]|uniref:rhodanese-like domain-containing protein n=1 Tax=Sporosarcina sp. 179-K 3D1 HS TaxID=3232169 RepID=UPI0039A1CBC6